MNLPDFNQDIGYTETHTDMLKRRLKMVGHASLANWMRKQGYAFRYAYYVCFNKFPIELKHEAKRP